MDSEFDDNEENGLSAAEMVFARLLSGNTSIEEAVDRACDSDPKIESALRKQLNRYLQRRQQRLHQKNSSEEKKSDIEGLAGLILDKYSADLDINYSFISDNEVPMTPEFDGRYDLLEEIARGGMGAIFSIKDPVLQRELAMKVVLGNEKGQAPPQRIYRFLREARITAKLSHPGIVPVHELNSDNEGRYFFTMDRINGNELRDVMIAYNSGDPKWDLNRLLEVLLHVCDTLEFAHVRDVIHRDIKPSNIMVGKFGEVYVMDWGLARQINGPEEDPLMDIISEKVSTNENGSTIVTKDGAVVGTPSYMSPEQASPETSEIGPWTDVYAVGALLYEILTGSPPYRNSEKPLPGQKVLKLLKEGPPEDVHKLAPDAPEDLIQICKIAMQRDPKDRPKDCGEVSQMIRKVQRSRAKDARITREAKDNARKSKAVNQFLTSLFINPEEENPTLYGLNAHKLLELGAEKLLSEGPGEAEIQVTLISTLASIFLETGDPVRAESLLEKECVIRREHSHWPGEDLIAALRKLATAQKALRKLEKTESTLQEAIEQKVLSQDQTLFTEVQQELADLLNLRGDWFQAEEMFRDLILNLVKDKSSKKIQALLGLSRCYSYQGDWLESEKNLELAMDIATKSRSEEICPELPELLFEKAGLFLESQRDNVKKEQLIEARSYLEKAIELQIALKGEQSSITARYQRALSCCLQRLGETDEAEKVARAALVNIRMTHILQHPLCARSFARLASILFQSGQDSTATKLLQEAGLSLDIEAVRKEHRFAALEARVRLLSLSHQWEDARKTLKQLDEEGDELPTMALLRKKDIESICKDAHIEPQLSD